MCRFAQLYAYHELFLNYMHYGRLSQIRIDFGSICLLPFLIQQWDFIHWKIEREFTIVNTVYAAQVSLTPLRSLKSNFVGMFSGVCSTKRFSIKNHCRSKRFQMCQMDFLSCCFLRFCFVELYFSTNLMICPYIILFMEYDNTGFHKNVCQKRQQCTNNQTMHDNSFRH